MYDVWYSYDNAEETQRTDKGRQMAKPKKIYIDGYDFFMWPYEEQTKMKHKVVSDYFGVWATKLGVSRAVNFFDCHGGCGAYWDEESQSVCWGSSILVAQKASELSERLKREVNIYVSEKDAANATNLNAVITSLTLPVAPKVANISFEEVMANKAVKNLLYSKSPSLFFVDPFGFSLSYRDLESAMAFERNELVVNFMFDYINRFIALPTLETVFTAFFGCEDWKKACEMSGSEREAYLVDLYRRQLKKFSKYVFPFRLSVYDADRTYYYLFHATNHIDGASIMKSCFASLNNGKVEYLGNRSNNLSLFDLDEVKTEEVATYLLARFSGQRTSFISIVETIIDDTMFLEKDIRAALKWLREQGRVVVIPITSKKTGIRGLDEIVFPETER